MDNQIQQDPYRILARERSHEDARQTVPANRMLVQSLVIVNGGAAVSASCHPPAGLWVNERAQHYAVLDFTPRLTLALFSPDTGLLEGMSLKLDCDRFLACSDARRRPDAQIPYRRHALGSAESF